MAEEEQAAAKFEEQAVFTKKQVGKRHSAPKAPVWWMNTFFWFAGILFLLAVIGLVGGDRIIRDPGQRPEVGLPWIYLGGALLMVVNGYITHKQALQHFAEADENDL